MERTAKELIEALSSGPVRQYLTDHQYDDVREIVLKHKEILGVPTARLFDQIATRRKAKDKLPVYYRNDAVVYPPPENFEQSSSEKTAAFKADIAQSFIPAEHLRVADLTGGFGVDAYFLSAKSEAVDYVEADSTLLELARYNHRLLGAHNISYHLQTAEEFIRTTRKRYDAIYIDPSRRPGRGKKIHALEDSEPDITKMLDDIFAQSDWLLVKTSPLLDIQAGISKLSFVKHVFIVSVDNECKEVLFLARKGFSGIPAVTAVNITGAETRDSFEFTFSDERSAMIEYGDPGDYLYEPNASILKAGAFKTVAKRFDLRKVHPSTHLYTGDQLLENFPGRKFRIEAFVKPEPREVLKFFPEAKGNVTTRNYPLTPEALKKRTGLRDGGEKFLIGFSGQKKKFLVVATRV